MSEFHPTKVTRPRPRLTLRKVLNFWPLLIWAGVAVGAVMLNNSDPSASFSHIGGVVDVTTESIVPLEDGTIKEVKIRTGEVVKIGQPIVELDSREIDDKIGILKKKIDAHKANRIQDLQIDLNRLSSETRDIQRRLSGEEAELKSVKEELEDLLKISKTSPIYPQIAPIIGKDQRLVASLTATTALYPKQLKEIDDSKAFITKTITETEKGEGSANPEDQIDQLELRTLEARKERLTLKSQHEGVVERTGKEVGEYVKTGETIARVVAKASTITGFVPQDQIPRLEDMLQTGRPVYLCSNFNHTTSYAAKIVGLAPKMTSAPDSTSAVPGRKIHGQEVTIEFPSDCPFKPGQAVAIYIIKPGEISFLRRIFGDPDIHQ